MALDKGIEDLKLKYNDNFWQILPIERMQITQEEILPGQSKNPNFDRAEEKATKAIQRRSMNIGGKEKNPQMDEAHLLLGKARYYDHRYVPALEAFNYILYKYPESDKIYEAKIWRERTNMRMENDALAIKNLRKLLGEIKFKDQVFADANATLAQAFLNVGQKDSAVVRLEKALEYTKSNEEKARYRFILAQLFDEAGEKQKAFDAYQAIIDMKRKSPRRYVIQAHARQGLQFDIEKGDTLVFLEKYEKLLKDRENRPYLDVLNHQMALFYDKRDNNKQAKKYYNISLRTRSEDKYLMASNYRNLADIYFDSAKYQDAGLYYDSTLVRLEPRTREYRLIKKKRENLADVIKYEAIAQKNDSILNVVSLSESDKKGFYEDYIAGLKKKDEQNAKLEKSKREKEERQSANTGRDDMASGTEILKTNDRENLKKRNTNQDEKVSLPRSPSQNTNPNRQSAKPGEFYFYNPNTVAYGKIEFRKKWGDRPLKNNWRLASAAKNDNKSQEDSDENEIVSEKDSKKEKEIDVRYTTDFYIKQLPIEAKILDSLAKERNFAYYQLGIIYKEKFKEYKLAASKLEQLLKNNPEERLVLPSMYNLYKIYQIIDKDKALAMQSEVITQYPASRYAQILGNSGSSDAATNQSPEVAYDTMFKMYEEKNYIHLLNELEIAVGQYTGEEIISKMELLKANTIGKLKGLAEYKSALNFVALNYPSSDEGKEAEKLLSTQVPVLERLQFDAEVPNSWKIIYKVSNIETPETKAIQDKIGRFASERTSEKLTSSLDIYTMTENFIVLHGIRSEENAKGIVSILTDYKDYLISAPAIVISNENYKIVQIKKNLPEYLLPHPKPVKNTAPAVDEKSAQQKVQPVKNEQRGLKQESVKKSKSEEEIKKADPMDTDDPLPENSLPPTPKKPK